MLVDTHCHLQDPAFDGDRDTVVQRALNALAWLVVVGDNVASSRAAIALVRPRVFATVGIHPHHANEATETALAELQTPAREEPGVVAVGEIGLDYHYNFSPRDVQRGALDAQLRLACELGLPVVIHNRKAHDDVLAALRIYAPSLCGGVMHCFDGDAAFAEQCQALGLYISFAGNVTFAKREDLRAAARTVDRTRLLVETDSPYLAPQPVRGQRCEPVHVRHTAEALASLRGETLTDFFDATTANACRLFRVNKLPEPNPPKSSGVPPDGYGA